MSYHGVAYVDMAHLLYPGATRVRGAFKVYPYTDAEYIAKVNFELNFKNYLHFNLHVYTYYNCL